MKILFTADFHIGNISDSRFGDEHFSKPNETFRQLDKMISFAKRNSIECFMILGDMYHVNKPIPMYERMVIYRLNELEKEGIKTVIILGNHEASNINESALSPLKAINYKNINIGEKIDNIEIAKINFIIVPHLNKNYFGQEHSNEEFIGMINQEVKRKISKTKKNIIIGHFHASGAVIGSEQMILRGGVNILNNKEFFRNIDKMFLGHIHKHQEYLANKIPIIYPGSIVRTDFSETEEEKGFVVYDTSKDKSVFIKNDTTEYANIDLDFTKNRINDKQIEKIAKDKILKLRIKISDEDKNGININEICEHFNKYGYVARKEIEIVKTKNEIKKYDSKNFSNKEILNDYIKELDIKDVELKNKLKLKCHELLVNNQKKENQLFPSINKMHLNKIKLKNFRSFKDVNIDLSDVSIAGIIGTYKNDDNKSNGSGKTTLMTSIVYALYGYYKNLSDSDLLNKEEEMEVEVELKINDKIMIIKRGKNKKGTFLNLIIDDNNIEGKIREVQEYINNIIGMKYELFIATVFFLEKDLESFCSATPAVRKEYLRELLQLDIWDELNKESKIEYKNKSSDKSKLEIEINTLKEYLKDINVEKIKNEIKKIEDEELTMKEKLQECKKIEKLFNEKICIYETLEQDKSKKERNISNLNNDLKNLKDRLNKMEIIDNDKLQKEIEFLKNKLSDLESEYEEYIKRITEVKLNGSNKKKQLEELNNVEGSECPVCGSEIDENKKKKLLKKYTDELEDLRNEYSSLKEKDNKKKIETYKEEIEDKIDQASKNSQIINSYNNLKERISETQKNLDKEIKSFNEIKKKLSELDAIDNNEYKKNEREIENINDKMKNMSESLGSYNQKMKQYKEWKSDYNTKIKEYDIINEDLTVCEFMQNIFGKNGISSKIINNSLKEIEEYSNKILNDIDNGEKKILFKSSKENKSGDMLDSLDIYIEDESGDERKYETYSQGESTLINFSIRLSLSYILSNMKNIWHGIIVLDEVFGSLDEYNREKIINVINYLKKDFGQIFVISHTQIKESFQNTIWIEKNSETNISTIKLVA